MNFVLIDELGVYIGVKNWCFKIDYLFYQNIDWVYVEENVIKKIEKMSGDVK